MRNVLQGLVKKPEEKRLLTSPWHRWEDNIRMDLRVEDVDWIHLD
jgi:hypothetical protein